MNQIVSLIKSAVFGPKSTATQFLHAIHLKLIQRMEKARVAHWSNWQDLNLHDPLRPERVRYQAALHSDCGRL